MIKDNIIRIKKEINGVLLLAVTKGRTIKEINESLQAGIKTIGESKVQELKEKLEKEGLFSKEHKKTIPK